MDSELADDTFVQTTQHNILYTNTTHTHKENMQKDKVRAADRMEEVRSPKFIESQESEYKDLQECVGAFKISAAHDNYPLILYSGNTFKKKGENPRDSDGVRICCMYFEITITF